MFKQSLGTRCVQLPLPSHKITIRGLHEASFTRNKTARRTDDQSFERAKFGDTKNPSSFALTKSRENSPKAIRQWSENIRRLYRATLRAITYLPDEFARQYMRDHLMRRFHHNSKKAPPSDKILLNRIKKAKHACHILQKASFYTKESRGFLEEVLMRAYGRKGPRRRVLLKEIFRKDEEEIPKDDAALQELINNPSGNQAANYEPSSKFFEFIHSQQHNFPLGYRSKIRDTRLVVPELNIWLRPMPKKAQLSFRKRWWAVMLDKLAPPVPLSEWERLKGFATGELEFDTVPLRRPKGLNVRRVGRRTILETPKKGVFDPEEGLPTRTEATDGYLRTVQRLYASLWFKTPTMKQDIVTKKWIITWGKQRSAAYNGEVSQPSQVQEEFFEGLEDQHQPAENMSNSSRGARKRARLEEARVRPPNTGKESQDFKSQDHKSKRTAAC